MRTKRVYFEWDPRFIAAIEMAVANHPVLTSKSELVRQSVWEKLKEMGMDPERIQEELTTEANDQG